MQVERKRPYANPSAMAQSEATATGTAEAAGAPAMSASQCATNVYLNKVKIFFLLLFWTVIVVEFFFNFFPIFLLFFADITRTCAPRPVQWSETETFRRLQTSSAGWCSVRKSFEIEKTLFDEF